MALERSDMKLEALTARSTLYKILALSFRHPDERLLKVLKSEDFQEKLTGAAANLSPRSVKKHTKGLSRALRTVEGYRQLETEYTHLFSAGDELNCPPYGTEYASSHVFDKVQQLADIMGFYEAFGFRIREDGRERPDYVGVEFEFMHLTALKEANAQSKNLGVEASVCRDARRKFLETHMMGWVPLFHKLVSKWAKTSFYTAAASLAAELLEEDARALKAKSPAGPTKLPVVNAPEDFSCPAEDAEPGALGN